MLSEAVMLNNASAERLYETMGRCSIWGSHANLHSLHLQIARPPGPAGLNRVTFRRLRPSGSHPRACAIRLLHIPVYPTAKWVV